jgi:ADP-ribosylglycohydrolase
MIGAIVGDVIGSVFENANVKSEDFPLFSRFSRFTDDTVLTIAVADAVLNRKAYPFALTESRLNTDLYARKIKQYGRRFPDAGYGKMFREWMQGESLRGYGSFGNGSAMRVSPIGFAFNDLRRVQHEARLSALVTHNHPEGIKGAQAVATAVFLARQGQTKDEIRACIEQHFRYDLHQRLIDIRPTYKFDASCQGSVPQAMIAFLESDDFEDAIRKAISLGGDSDTIASIAGAIAHAFYQKIPESLVAQTQLRLDSSFKQIIRAFNEAFQITF